MLRAFLYDFKSDELPFCSPPSFPGRIWPRIKIHGARTNRPVQLTAGLSRKTVRRARRLEKREESNSEATRYAKKRAARSGNEARSRGRDLAGTGMNAERSSVGSHPPRQT